jgi:hypothetical protein
MRHSLTLIDACHGWLKRRLPLFVFALVPLLLAATPVAQNAPSPRVSRVATASVQIIRLEPVSARPETGDDKSSDRQYRQRDNMPLVDFY